MEQGVREFHTRPQRTVMDNRGGNEGGEQWEDRGNKGKIDRCGGKRKENTGVDENRGR